MKKITSILTMKKVVIAVLVLFSAPVFAQQNVGIGTTTPNPKAILDLVSTTQGFLMPRMTTAQRGVMTLGASEAGLVVYDSDLGKVLTWNGSSWDTGSTVNDWALLGNAGTTASNFLGTTDAVALRFRTNNTERMLIDANGNVGIGTTSPNQLLEILGGENSAIDLRTGTLTLRSSVNSISGAEIGTVSGHDLRFFTSNVSRVAITSVGNVGIGTTNPLSPLQLGNFLSVIPFDFGGGSLYSMFTYNAYPNLGSMYSMNNSSVGFMYMGNDGGGNIPEWGIQLYNPMAANTNVFTNSADLRINLRNKGFGINVDNPGAALEMRSLDSAAIVMRVASNNDAPTIYFTSPNSGNRVGIRPHLTSNEYTLKLPSTLPSTAGQVLSSDLSGNMSWVTPSSGMPSGTFGQTLMHDGTTWAANSFLYNSVTAIGIGTTTPASDLHLFRPNGSRIVLDADGASTTGNPRIDFTTSGNASSTSTVGSVSGWQMRAFTGSFSTAARQNDFQIRYYNGSAFTDVMYFDNSGFVGLGTLNPSEVLDVVGNVKFSGAFMPNNQAGTAGQVLTSQGVGVAPVWQNTSSTNIYNTDGSLTGNRIVTQNANTLSFTSTATNGFSVDGTTFSVDAANNRIGIGTTAPAFSLDIVGQERVIFNSLTNSQVLYVGTTSTAGTASSSSRGIFIQRSGANTNSSHSARGLQVDVTNTGTTSTNIGAYLSASGATNNYALVIPSTGGSVGIGTETPTTRLHIENSTSPAFRLVDGTQAAGRVLTTDANGNASWQSLPAASQDWTLLGNAGTISGTNFLGTTDAQDLDIRTNNVIKHRFTQQGQLEFLNTGNSVFIGANAGQNDDLTNNENTYVGYYSGNANTTGQWNTAIGSTALSSNTVGSNNTAVGRSTLTYNTGSNNTGIGTYSLFWNTSGNSNTATGYFAAEGNTTGSNNTAYGYMALRENETGNSNTAIGYQAAYNHANGDIVAIGSAALYSNTTGNYNTAVGTGALRSNTINSASTAVGWRAFYNSTGSYNTGVGHMAGNLTTSGGNNTTMGTWALYSNTTSSNNTSIGYQSLYNTTGAGNTALGTLAGDGNTTGSSNTFIGYNTDAVSNGLTNATAIGANAVVQASNTVQLGNNANVDFDLALMPNGNAGTSGDILTSQGVGVAPIWQSAASQGIVSGTGTTNYVARWTNSTTLGTGVLQDNGTNVTATSNNASDLGTSGVSWKDMYADGRLYIQDVPWTSIVANNTFIGVKSNEAITSGLYNLGVGDGSGRSITVGNRNTMVGHRAGELIQGSSDNTMLGNLAGGLGIPGSNNTFLGSYAGYGVNNTASNNTFVGAYVGGDNTTGTYNVATGATALYVNTTGSYNTATGYSALRSNVSGDNNSAYGYYSLHYNTGSSNSGYGAYSLFNNSSGVNNAAIGVSSLYSNTTGGHNTGLGVNAMAQNTIGGNNTAVGYQALNSNVAGSQATAVGYQAMLYANNSGTAFNSRNVALGYQALRGSATAANNTGTENTALGYQTLLATTSGFNNTAAGHSALFATTTGYNNTAHGYFSLVANTTGHSNTAVGANAGDINTTGNNNTFIGNNADATVNNLTNATAIGANASVSASNSLVLGNGANVGISIANPTYRFTVYGNQANALTGPNMSFITSQDAFPTFHLLNWNHSEQWMLFNSYYDGSFRSSGTSNFAMYTNNYGSPGILHIGYANGIAQGSNVGFSNAISVQAAGNLGIHNSSPSYPLDVIGNSRFQGFVGIGTTPTYPLDVYSAGDLYGLRVDQDRTTSGTVYGAFIDVDNTYTGTSGHITHGLYATALNNGGTTSATYGVRGLANGSSTGDKYAIYGSTAGSGALYAGYFVGNATVTGTLSKGGGTFKIDHPLDPENKYLYHSFVESPDMMNIYNGNIITDASGTAIIKLPDYFEALNMEFRYQLTVIGTFAQAIVSKKITGNTFEVKTDHPNVEVSWQVTGVRKDPWADAHRVVPEVKKDAKDKGKYLHPIEYGKPVRMGINESREMEEEAERLKMEAEKKKEEAERLRMEAEKKKEEVRNQEERAGTRK